MEPLPLPPASPDDRRALRTLQLGVVAVVLAAAPYKTFELDRFFVPKETALHATAALAMWWAAVARRPDDEPAAPWRPAAVDLALAAYLALSAASALLADNGWLATRSLAISISGAATFWAARALTRRGLGRPLLAAAAGATALAATTALLQAYGVRTELFSLNRAPGGTFGNRNFVAHLAAIGVPLLAAVALRTPTPTRAFLPAAGLALASALLVLSRTRAAWLALAVAAVPLAVGLRRATPGSFRPGRVAMLALACIIGATVAVTVPNELDWRSDSPYLDSVRGMVDYQSGSGGGRLKQWRNSARMLADRPLLGVGPGNWPVRYPRHAPRRDPSLAADGTTANPWPSSDWVAIASERGLALLPLAALLAILALQAHRAVWRPPSPDAPLLGALLGALLAATTVVGAFDAVLLLAAPTLVVWIALGVLSVECRDPVASPNAGRPPSRLPRRLIAAAIAAASALAALRSGSAWSAMALLSTVRPADLAIAGRLDPGSYRIRLRLAELAARRGRCAAVREHAGAARALLPEAAAPRRLLARCPVAPPRRPRRRG